MENTEKFSMRKYSKQMGTNIFAAPKIQDLRYSQSFPILSFYELSVAMAIKVAWKGGIVVHMF